MHRRMAGSAALLVTLIALTACAAQSGQPTTQGAKARVPVAEAKLVYFKSQPFGLRRAVATLLRTEADARAFAGWFGAQAPSDLATTLAESVRPGRVLAAFANGNGCTSAQSARLINIDEGGATDFDVQLISATTYPECVARNDVVAVFSLPEDQVPAGVRLRGRSADPPGPAS